MLNLPSLQEFCLLPEGVKVPSVERSRDYLIQRQFYLKLQEGYFSMFSQIFVCIMLRNTSINTKYKVFSLFSWQTPWGGPACSLLDSASLSASHLASTVCEKLCCCGLGITRKAASLKEGMFILRRSFIAF